MANKTIRLSVGAIFSKGPGKIYFYRYQAKSILSDLKHKVELYHKSKVVRQNVEQDLKKQLLRESMLVKRVKNASSTVCDINSYLL